MVALATQKTPDQAAALIQARVRGLQQRQREQRMIRAVTKLQARQRARYTRREFQKLLEFYNEQESFLQESKRRQLRLWHREQELYFLQHTTAEELEAIRAFQYNRGARRIQREWRRGHPTPLEDVDVSGLGQPFDPFGLGPLANLEPLETTVLPNRAVVMQELYGELPRKVATCVDDYQAARRRAEIQERLQRMRKEKDRETRERQRSAPTRRELYTELVSLRERIAQRLDETHGTYRTRRAQRDLDAVQLSASCRNRIAFLLDETRVNILRRASGRSGQSEQIAAEKRALERDASTWSDARKRHAWESHARIVQSVLGKDKWYETYIAGEKRDIRRVYAESPWHHDKQVWQWPPPPPDSTSSPSRSLSQEKPPSEWSARGGLTAMDRFRFCLPEHDGDDDDDDENQANNQDAHGLHDARPLPVDDKLASEWWRAHATQSHASYKRLQERRLQQLRRRSLFAGEKGNNTHSEDAQVTPEMLANPAFYEFYRRTHDAARDNERHAAVDAQITQLQHRIQRQVVDVETQIELNTRLIYEQRERVLQQKARQTKEEVSAIHIQRVARGKLGRKRAHEHLAQYFVMVRGRAIRKGKCEECGAQPAVLECKECEESLHFCPVCWVQVHSTRRRKTHVPIPMSGSVPAANPVERSPSRGAKDLPGRPAVGTRPPSERIGHQEISRATEEDCKPRGPAVTVSRSVREPISSRSVDREPGLRSTAKSAIEEPSSTHAGPAVRTRTAPGVRETTATDGESIGEQEIQPAVVVSGPAKSLAGSPPIDLPPNVALAEETVAAVVGAANAPQTASTKLPASSRPTEPGKASGPVTARTGLRHRMTADKPQREEQAATTAASDPAEQQPSEAVNAVAGVADPPIDQPSLAPAVVVEPPSCAPNNEANASKPKRALDEQQAARTIQSLRRHYVAKQPDRKDEDASSTTIN